MSVELKEKILVEIKQNLSMIKLPTKLLLAVSGGVDSVALSYLLAELKAELEIELAVTHLDHQLRGKASLADYQLVEALAKELKLDFYGFSRDVAAEAERAKLGFESYARQLRYQLFYDLLERLDYDYLVTAHHSGDNAESILLHLIRGSGAQGLRGMETQKRRLLRPLLTIEKEQLYQLADFFAWQYREDASNRELAYSRNRLRHSIIPQIEEYYNPAFQAKLLQLADIIKAEDDYLQYLTDEQFQHIAREQGDCLEIELSSWRELPLAIRRRLLVNVFMELNQQRQNISFEHINILDDWLINGRLGSKQIFFGLQWRLLVKSVIITRLSPKNSFEQVLAITIGDNYSSEAELLITATENAEEQADLYLPLSLFQQGLYLRSRRPGDYILPLGMNGHRKSLKKFLQEEKINYEQRENIPILVIKSQVIWVKGIRKSIYAKKKAYNESMIAIRIKESKGEFNEKSV